MLGIENERSIVDNGCRGETFFQSGRVDERFKTRTGLPPSLGDMVELIVVEIKAADQCIDFAVTRAGGDKGGFDLGDLYNLPEAFFIVLDTD